MMEDHAHFSPKDLISASWTTKIHLKNFILLPILFYFILFQSISTSQNNICFFFFFFEKEVSEFLLN